MAALQTIDSCSPIQSSRGYYHRSLIGTHDGAFDVLSRACERFVEQEPLLLGRLSQPIPRPEIVACDQYENYLETPPEGLEVEDAEVIWWTEASSFSREELRSKLVPVIEKRQDWACFFFSPLADLEGNGRYPSGVIQLLRDILPKGALIAVEPAAGKELSELAGTLAIQNLIWHELN